MLQPQPTLRKFVLVVEDEPLLRMLAVAVVEEAGFDAIEAWDADEAVRVLEGRDDIAIATDIEMPGSLDGRKLAAAIRDRWPPIHIIVTSGHVEVHGSTLPEGAVFFTKPYDAEQVASTLRHMSPTL